MIKEFQYAFNDLQISATEIEELMGFEKGNAPEPFPELINNALKDVSKYTEIKGGYKIFENINFNIEKQTMQVGPQLFLPAKIIITQLNQAKSAALFLCTAGAGISEHAKNLSLEGDTLLSYVFDVIGSLTVDKAMDNIQEELKTHVNKHGLNISDRYSPGYCEWSVSDQQKLFSLMPKKFCGITLSSTSLMNPIKSVSGIIGIGEELQQKGYQCNWCNDLQCIYGKIKRKKKN